MQRDDMRGGAFRDSWVMRASLHSGVSAFLRANTTELVLSLFPGMGGYKRSAMYRQKEALSNHGIFQHPDLGQPSKNCEK